MLIHFQRPQELTSRTVGKQSKCPLECFALPSGRPAYGDKWSLCSCVICFSHSAAGQVRGGEHQRWRSLGQVLVFLFPRWSGSLKPSGCTHIQRKALSCFLLHVPSPGSPNRHPCKSANPVAGHALKWKCFEAPKEHFPAPIISHRAVQGAAPQTARRAEWGGWQPPAGGKSMQQGQGAAANAESCPGSAGWFGFFFFFFFPLGYATIPTSFWPFAKSHMCNRNSIFM